jgi:signal peptidase I
VIFLRPSVLGGAAEYVIVTGASMEPALGAGDLVVSLSGPPYVAGDVVVYRIPSDEDYAGRLIVHRIVDGSAGTAFVAQGDNAAHRDPWPVAESNIAGRVVAMIPAGGRLLILLRNPLVLASLTAGFVFVFLVWPSPRPKPASGPDGTIGGGHPGVADDGLIRVA